MQCQQTRQSHRAWLGRNNTTGLLATAPSWGQLLPALLLLTFHNLAMPGDEQKTKKKEKDAKKKKKNQRKKKRHAGISGLVCSASLSPKRPTVICAMTVGVEGLCLGTINEQLGGHRSIPARTSPESHSCASTSPWSHCAMCESTHVGNVAREV